MNDFLKLLWRLPSTRLFRADRIFSLRENFLLRCAYGRLWRHRAIRTLHNPAEKGIDYGAYHNNFNYDQGYIALVTVLVIGAVMLSVGMAVVLNSINTGQGSLGEIKKESGISFVESCVEDALIKINVDNALNGSVILPEGTCTVTINSQVGSNWDFTVAGTFDGYSKSIRVSATRDTKVTVNSWIEI